MTSYIIDTSVFIKYVLPEEDSTTVEILITLHRASDIRLSAPDFILTECANVLWKHVRREGMAVEDAVFALNRLINCAVHLTPQSGLLDDALQSAANLNIAVYDALFCVLAERENAPLITADAALLRRLSGSAIQAIAPSQWLEP